MEEIKIENIKSNYYNYCDNGAKLIKKSKKNWDWIIITAANEMQKHLYEIEIENRLKDFRLPKKVRFDVVADSGGKRIGSGGAFLNVLKYVEKNDEKWKNKKILLINSGGDSKRIPHCSFEGKIFAKIPKDNNGHPSTLFDEIFSEFSMLPDKIENGIFVVSGDVLLFIDYNELKIEKSDIFSFSVKADATIGANHGVFLLNEDKKMKKFLHKLSVEKLAYNHAINDLQMVNIDTGATWISSGLASDLLDLLNCNMVNLKSYLNEEVRLNFYSDLLYPLALDSTLETYLNSPSEGNNLSKIKAVRKLLWERLSKYTLNVFLLKKGVFLHLGTTKEMLDLYSNSQKRMDKLGWSHILSSKTSKELKDNVCLINTYIDSESCIGDNCYFENSIIKKANIGNNCMIFNTAFEGFLPDNMVLHLVPLMIEQRTFYVAKVYGVYDNPKVNKIFGIDINNNSVIKSTNNDIWNLELYEVCNSENEAISSIFRLLRIVNNEADDDDIYRWKNSLKVSMNQINNFVDHKKLIDLEERSRISVISEQLIEDFIINKKNIDTSISNLNFTNVCDVFEYLSTRRGSYDYKMDILLSKISLKYKSLINQDVCYEDECFEKIKKLVLKEKEYFDILCPDKDVIIKKPVRINFAGGWSDTPPYCLENGGTVLNAAIFLNGKLPIEVSVKKYNKGKYKFVSVDTKKVVEYYSIENIKEFNDIKDPFNLTKATLKCLNILESAFFEEYGIEIITNVDVPLGSGLGTSSILAGALVEAVCKFYKINIKEEQIFNIVLQIEQLISTGGGWQDQIGGLVPGIKLISTETGAIQKYDIKKIRENSNIKELEERMCLIYTGKRRIAKDLLRKVMKQYMYNNEVAIGVMKNIRELAILMKIELKYGKIDNFAKLLIENFDSVKKIDPGISNDLIDSIIDKCIPFCDGYTILGAGGGGFLYIILKKDVSKEDFKKYINTSFVNKKIAVYDCTFYR